MSDNSMKFVLLVGVIGIAIFIFYISILRPAYSWLIFSKSNRMLTGDERLSRELTFEYQQMLEFNLLIAAITVGAGTFMVLSGYLAGASFAMTEGVFSINKLMHVGALGTLFLISVPVAMLSFSTHRSDLKIALMFVAACTVCFILVFGFSLYPSRPNSGSLLWGLFAFQALKLSYFRFVKKFPLIPAQLAVRFSNIWAPLVLVSLIVGGAVVKRSHDGPATLVTADGVCIRFGQRPITIPKGCLWWRTGENGKELIELNCNMSSLQGLSPYHITKWSNGDTDEWAFLQRELDDPRIVVRSPSSFNSQGWNCIGHAAGNSASCFLRDKNVILAVDFESPSDMPINEISLSALKNYHFEEASCQMNL